MNLLYAVLHFILYTNCLSRQPKFPSKIVKFYNNKQTICEDSHPGLGGLDDDESDTEDTDEAEVRDFQSTYPMQIIKSLIKKLWLTDSNFNTFKVCFC